MTLKEIVENGNIARFSHYRDGNLWYVVEIPDLNLSATSTAKSAIEEAAQKTVRYQFPISNEEAKGGTFLAEHKAVTLMRWIRKAIESDTLQRAK